MQRGQADLEIEGYHYYLNSAVKKGIVEHLFIVKKTIECFLWNE